MPDIFLSYSEKDRTTAGQLADALQATGWSVWWDRRIPAGQAWRDVLTQALEQMRCMVVLWSADSVKSQWVCEEAEEGKARHCLVPVCIAAVRPPTGFRSIQAADLVCWDGSIQAASFQRLVADIQQMIGAPPMPRPAAAAASRSATADAPRRRRGWLGTVLVGAAAAAGIGWWASDRAARSAISERPANTPRPAAIALPPASVHQPDGPDRPERPASGTAAVADHRPRPEAAAASSPSSAMSSANPSPLPPASRPTGTSPPVRTAATRPARAAVTARCSELTARAALSDTLSAADRQQLQKECAR